MKIFYTLFSHFLLGIFLLPNFNPIVLVNCEKLSHLHLTGSNCTLTEPLYSTTFNFTSLHSDLGHTVHASETGDKYDFNVCQPMEKLCNKEKGTFACLRQRNGSEIVFGRQSALQMVDGRLQFNFTSGDKCKTGLNYSLTILLSCEYDYQKIKEPLDIFDGAHECSYFMLWKTSRACPPLPDNLKANKCTTKDKSGNIFNLNSLSHSTHTVRSDQGSAVFYVSICKPVHYHYGQMCPPGSSVCWENVTAQSLNEKFFDYGQTVPDPEIENGQLVMNLPSNQTCPTSSKDKISSKITFKCSEKEQRPQHDGLEGCVHKFTWLTPLACDQKRQCTTIDERTGKIFDFTSLSNKAYNVTYNGKNYVFGVCNVPKFDLYDDKSGALQIQGSQTVSLGILNDNLQYNETGSPYLLYESGAKCDSKFWTTKIEFVCETDDVTYTPPKIVEDNKCQLFIQMETELACQKQISCTAHDSEMNEISLIPLMRNSSNYEAKINETTIKDGNEMKKYYLNVCRPLVPLYGLGCPGGSSACMGVQSGGLLEKEESLGFPDISLTAVGKRFQLKYLRGGTCEKDPDTDLSSVIEFYCDLKAGQGNPILQEIKHDCHYHFEWATNGICPAHQCEYRKEACEIYNHQMNVSVNLKDIISDGVVKLDNKMNICDKNISITTDYGKRTAFINFASEKTCADGTNTTNVELRLVCRDTKRVISENDKSSCHHTLVQVETPLICPFVGLIGEKVFVENETTPSTNNGTDNSANKTDTTQSGGMSKTGIFFVVITIISLAFGSMLLVLRNPERRAYLQSLLRRRNVLIHYSRVRSNEEASLLLNAPGSLSDSDDEMLI